MRSHPFTTPILLPTEESIQQVTSALLAGQVVAIPTETVYGLAAVAWNEGAVAEIFAAKARPHFDPLIVHIAPPLGNFGLAMLDQDLGLVDWHGFETLSPLYRLLTDCWPGPLTVVLPKASRVPELVTSGLETVAVRMPSHPLTQTVLQTVGQPLAAPSANRFGHISPTTAAAVYEELGGRIPYILDGGPCTVGLESTVIRYLPDGSWQHLRPGGVSCPRISDLLGRDPSPITVSGHSPGHLASHYAPHKPFYRLAHPFEHLTPIQWQGLRTSLGEPVAVGLLVMQGDPQRLAADYQAKLGIPVQVFSLSVTGDLTTAARTLFQTLRDLDHCAATVLVTEPTASDEGLGAAIADRLQRASQPLDL